MAHVEFEGGKEMSILKNECKPVERNEYHQTYANLIKLIKFN